LGDFAALAGRLLVEFRIVRRVAPDPVLSQEKALGGRHLVEFQIVRRVAPDPVLSQEKALGGRLLVEFRRVAPDPVDRLPFWKNLSLEKALGGRHLVEYQILHQGLKFFAVAPPLGDLAERPPF
jgi:hypothetical protein